MKNIETVKTKESGLSIYEKKSAIGYSTIGKQGTLKIVSIMNLLQDAASEHAHLMGISGFDLARQNLGWVIFRYHIEINNHPGWQDKITIRTHRFPCKNLYEIRLLTINREEEYQEDQIVNAKGCWVMVNKKNGRPVRLSRFMDRESGFINKDSSCSQNSETSNESEGLESHFPDVIGPETVHYQLPFKVRMHDLDLNGHVNNAIFVEWAVETVPEHILSKFFPATIDVIFNKESLYGDIIQSHTEIKEESGTPVTLHSIVRQQDQVELAILNICWQTLPEKRWQPDHISL